ncbi:2-hydroxyhepta-2,4-diene-1,7-dioate isomerase [Amylibacter kogurei]|uniref:2-hydroxyhepta-2,4-diene-1,7-dioate isomerase n=1 Tax=Paramylibacter kogurei TaxID=1889778 RepID=A0A2G5KAM9_9RHOB|nr:fumarylacetoacetate hydrolase family protein [Amylibacter kogurei]PIB25930.1 2-hydroxyhepta-2,4-diene-1,7-dioate isomerase [Amylibacter kogurei]
MRLISFFKNGESRAGAVIDDRVVDLTVQFGVKSVRDLLDIGTLEDVSKSAAQAATDYDLDDVDLDIPVPNARKIYCVGVNYMNRNAEYKDNSDAPKYPSLFVRNPMSFSAHGRDILIPPESEQLDYEGEIVLVIGKKGRRISQDAAMDHVAGLTIMNEGSIRDWIRHGKFNVTPGKNWDRSGGMGPWIETDLSEIDIENLMVETRVNGEIRQKDTTASMAFPFKRIIEYVSNFGTLLPGDIIATGTPTGSGARFDPPIWLREGDVVEVSVEGVGTLSNTVAKEVI